MAARISSFCQVPSPLAPMNTAQVAHSSNAFSMAGCQRSPGIRFHISSHGLISLHRNRTASSSTAGLSAPLCERNTWYLKPVVGIASGSTASW